MRHRWHPYLLLGAAFVVWRVRSGAMKGAGKTVARIYFVGVALVLPSLLLREGDSMLLRIAVTIPFIVAALGMSGLRLTPGPPKMKVGPGYVVKRGGLFR